MSDHTPVFVAKPSLPPLVEFVPYLEKIWDSRVLTNGGPFHQELESALCKYLDVPYVSLFANGTLALTAALRALNVSGEVITTPFSFVATSHALLMNGNAPVFVDIDPTFLNLDPAKIEMAVSPKTSAILAVHCFGNPCQVDAIQKIADAHNLKVIYDAAHAFGVDCHCGSVLNHGDLSVLSFHATKVFNTFEGGAIVCHDIETKQRIDQIKNFGIQDEHSIVTTGFNGKMCEFSAALGLLQLNHFERYLRSREQVHNAYLDAFQDCPGITVVSDERVKRKNFSYFPILITEDFPLSRDQLHLILREKSIYVRKYFYPLITDIPVYKEFREITRDRLEFAVHISKQILCLPIYEGLDAELQSNIIKIIKQLS